MKNLFKMLTNTCKCNGGFDDDNHLHQHQTPPPPQPQQAPPPPQPQQGMYLYLLRVGGLFLAVLSFMGGVMNSASGSNTNGSGAQKQEDGKEDNEKKKSGGVAIGKIGGNHGTIGVGVSGPITMGNIG